MNCRWNRLAIFMTFMLSKYCEGINVAEGKNATQFTSLNYAGFDWTADKAVDGCVNQDDPDNQKCCSASQGVAASNFWRVDLGQAYTVSLIVVYGRFPGGETQLSGFQVYTMATASGSEILAYTDAEQYGDGIFNITLQPERAVRSVVIKRLSGDLITLCEVEVYDFSVTSTDATNMTNTTTPSTNQGMNMGVGLHQSQSALMSLTFIGIALLIFAIWL